MHAPITHEQSPIPKKMWSSIHPRNFGDHMTVCLPDHPSVLTVGEPTLNVNLLGSVGAWNLILYIHIVVNWQLSKQSIHWPVVSHDHIAGSDVNPSRLCVFFKFSADKLRVFDWSQAQVKVNVYLLSGTLPLASAKYIYICYIFNIQIAVMAVMNMMDQSVVQIPASKTWKITRIRISKSSKQNNQSIFIVKFC